MNRYIILNGKDGYKVIDFLGEIGTYWRESRMEFCATGMSEEEVAKKINELVISNKQK